MFSALMGDQSAFGPWWPLWTVLKEGDIEHVSCIFPRQRQSGL